MSSQPQIHHPRPRRILEATQPPSPQLQASRSPSRNKSFLNLTSSTLLGIYSPAGYDVSESSTPWGTGAQTPRTPSFFPGEQSQPQHASASIDTNFSADTAIEASGRPRKKSQSLPASRASIPALVLRTTLLFCFGMGYGLLVRHLHDDRKLAPFQVEGIIRPRNNWRYLVFWGVAGVLLGSAMPWLDMLFLDRDPQAAHESWTVRGKVKLDPVESEEGVESGVLGADWTPVVRSVGAFVGIAYAIRKLPWSSTLQASLTLALVNPVLWYLVDRSKPGFLLSALVGAAGTAILLASNSDMMPSPASLSSARPRLTNGTLGEMAGKGGWLESGAVSREVLEGGTWILSVLFCSCVCFGNVGRRLALRGGKGVRR
ncbi:hypothetical protein PZA11_000855 [Diplocarpon coronariae]|uniref:INSIG domain-containing protein n=1 Tax=Diplocarpon coronariae TaxID=2795749 RepID=A0A218ZDV1_9HELO|nr:hypothetical protein JHW43_005568 [Diplocarpon mali]OWP05713.1 hypothetical protein B2J93_1762 [Marssonina coronariae]